MGYPCGIHFLISQIVGYAALWLIRRSGGGMEVYYKQAIFLTGLAGVLSMIPCLWFYRRDRIARKNGGLVLPQKPWKLDVPEMILLLGLGAAFSEYANIFVGLMQSVLNYQSYQETMDQMMSGKSIWFLLLCMGIIAPVAEEIVFRWLIYLRLRDYVRMGTAMVISGMIFGIYHGNLVQAVYAGILGMIFAYFLEISGCLWSSVLLHIGANVWSLVSPYLMVWLADQNPMSVILTLLALLLILIYGIYYFMARMQGRTKRVL